MGLARLSFPPGSKKAYILDSDFSFPIQETPDIQTRIIVSLNETDRKFFLSNTIYGTSLCDKVLYGNYESTRAFYVVKGALSFGKCQEVCAGDFVFIPADRKYHYTVEEPGTELLLFSSFPQQSTYHPYTEDEVVIHTEEKLNNGIIAGHISSSPSDSEYSPRELLTEVETLSANSSEPYLLRHGIGMNWVFGGFLTKPLLRQNECKDPSSISLMESTTKYPEQPFLDRWVCFTSIHHCFYVLEGRFRFKIKCDSEWNDVDFGQSFFVPCRTFFTVEVASEVARMIVFANGQGADEVVAKAGYAHEGPAMPEKVGKWDGWDEARVKSACAQLGAQIE